MHIWIVTTGEPLPTIDGENVRMWRSALLAECLLKKGHTVLRWSSTFDHTTKRQRSDKTGQIELSEKYIVKLLRSPGYSTNISFARLRDHRILAEEFSAQAKKEAVPDIIICSLPTIELCRVATDYGEENNVPVVLDARDMWPDIFEDLVPRPFKFIPRYLFSYLYKDLKKACSKATAFCGISKPYLDWQAANGGRKLAAHDRVFPHAYDVISCGDNNSREEIEFWKSNKVNPAQDFIVCMFSAMGNVVDIEPVHIAAQKLLVDYPLIKFVLCGQGDKLNAFRSSNLKPSNVIYPGWVDATRIQSLMKYSKLGILPYKNIKNYILNIPNKFGEYLSGGLPVLSAVKGLVEEELLGYECGFTYDGAGDLAEKIKLLYNNPGLLEKLSANAANLFREKYCAENVYSEMADHIVHIAANY